MHKLAISDKAIRDTLDEILKRREFNQTVTENPVNKAIKQMLNEIWEWIKRLFQRYGPKHNLQFDPDLFKTRVTNVLKIILIVAAVILLFFIIRLIVKRVYLPIKRRKSSVYDANEYLNRPDEVIIRIKELIGQKDYTAAFCFLFVAVLLELDKRKVLKIEKWKTNRMYIREIRQNSKDLFAKMSEFSASFNRCRYGGRIMDEEGFEAWYEFFLNIRETEV
jgi:hypothetical protein